MAFYHVCDLPHGRNQSKKKIKTSILNSKRISNCPTENKKRKTGLSRSANRDCFYHLNFSPESTMKISAPSLNK